MSRYNTIIERLPKVLVAHVESCVGCGRCALICSFEKTGEFNRAKSRIKIVRANPSVDAPIICEQCGICISACPSQAIARNRKTGAVIINAEKCNGCGQCIHTCPVGAITLDPEEIKAVKCDLCDGNPACVRACNFTALTFERLDRAVYYRQLQAALNRSKFVEGE